MDMIDRLDDRPDENADDHYSQRIEKQLDELAKVSPFVRAAIERMKNAPRFLSAESWAAFSEYEMNGGPVVSGDPRGVVHYPPPPKRARKRRK